MSPETCLDPFAACLCILDRGHTEVHRCACGGEWEYGEDGTLIPITIPHRNVGPMKEEDYT